MLESLQIAYVKDRFQVHLSSRMIFLNVVDENRCSDTFGADALDESLQGQTLTARVDEIIHCEDPVAGSDKPLGQAELKMPVFVVRGLMTVTQGSLSKDGEGSLFGLACWQFTP